MRVRFSDEFAFLVSLENAFYVDTLELYSARHRAVFLKDTPRAS